MNVAKRVVILYKHIKISNLYSSYDIFDADAPYYKEELALSGLKNHMSYIVRIYRISYPYNRHTKKWWPILYKEEVPSTATAVVDQAINIDTDVMTNSLHMLPASWVVYFCMGE